MKPLAVWLTAQGLLAVTADGCWFNPHGARLTDVQPHRYIGPWRGLPMPATLHPKGSVWRKGPALWLDETNEMAGRGLVYIGPFDRNAPGRARQKLVPRVRVKLPGQLIT